MELGLFKIYELNKLRVLPANEKGRETFGWKLARSLQHGWCLLKHWLGYLQAESLKETSNLYSQFSSWKLKPSKLLGKLQFTPEGELEIFKL